MCFQTSSLVKSRIRRAPGALVCKRQGDGRPCSTLGLRVSLHGCSKRSGQVGQALIEYVIVFALIGMALSVMWSLISSLAGFEAVRFIVHMTYSGWADFLLG